MADGMQALDLLMRGIGYGLNTMRSATEIALEALKQLMDGSSQRHFRALKKGMEDALIMPSYFMADDFKKILRDNGISSEIMAVDGRGLVFVNKEDSLKANLLLERYYMDLERGANVNIELLRNHSDNNVMEITLPDVEGYMLTEKMLDAGIPHTTLEPDNGEVTIQFPFKELDSVDFLRASETAFFMDSINRNTYLKQYDHKNKFADKIKDMALGKVHNIPEGMVITNGHGCTVQFSKGKFSVTEKFKPKIIAFDDKNIEQNIDAVIKSWTGDEAIKDLLKEEASKEKRSEKFQSEIGNSYTDSFGREIEFIDGGIRFTQVGVCQDYQYGKEDVAENLVTMLFEDADNFTGEPAVMTKEQFKDFQDMPVSQRVEVMTNSQHHLGDNPIFTDVGNRPELTAEEKEHALKIKDVREPLNYPVDERTDILVRQMTARNVGRTLGIPYEEINKELEIVNMDTEQRSEFLEEFGSRKSEPVSLDDMSRQVLEEILQDPDRCKEFFESIGMENIFDKEQEFGSGGDNVRDPQAADWANQVWGNDRPPL